MSNITKEMIVDMIWQYSYMQSWLDKPREAYGKDSIKSDTLIQTLFDDAYYVKFINDIESYMGITLSFIWALDYKTLTVDDIARYAMTTDSIVGPLDIEYLETTIKKFDEGHSRITQAKFQEAIKNLKNRYEHRCKVQGWEITL